MMAQDGFTPTNTGTQTMRFSNIFHTSYTPIADKNGTVSAMDALIVINELSRT